MSPGLKIKLEEKIFSSYTYELYDNEVFLSVWFTLLTGNQYSKMGKQCLKINLWLYVFCSMFPNGTSKIRVRLINIKYSCGFI